MKIEAYTCNNLGGIDRLWLANQAVGQESIVSDANGFTDLILNRDGFTEIEFETGGLTEEMTITNAGDGYSTGITLSVRKHRVELLAFEKLFQHKRLLAVCYTNNEEWMIVRNLELSRVADTGQNPSAYNRVNYQLSGNSIDNATFGIATQAIFWLQTRFNPIGLNTFDPAITFSGSGKFRFANFTEVAGNSISVDGVAQGLDGKLQTVVFDSESSALGITELFFREDTIAGVARLDLLPNLVTADLSLNEIEEAKAGSWVNNAGVLIELRDNRMDADAQEQFVQSIYDLINTIGDLKVSLLNQTDGAGNDYLPNQATIDLAVLLYNDFGAEIYLSKTETELTYGID